MLFTIQYPIADIRPILPDEGGRLGRPTWPSAQVQCDFVRSFGGVQKRNRGGLPGWVGEGVHCAALKSLRFCDSQPWSIRANELGINCPLQNIPVRIAYRRLYADGLVLVKAEVGFSIPDSLLRDAHSHPGFLIAEHLLSAKLNIRVGSDPRHQITIAHAGKRLAEAYGRATTGLLDQPVSPEDFYKTWWVTPGRPILFWEGGPLGESKIPSRCRIVPVDDIFSGILGHAEILTEFSRLPMWFLSIPSSLLKGQTYKRVRAMRICLLRLHAECECLRIVLQKISTNRVPVEPRSVRSDTLQHYIRTTIQRINGLTKEADGFSETELAEIARNAIHHINPTEREEILGTLRNLDVRKHIFDKVEEFISTQFVIQKLELNMNTYNVKDSKVGIIGEGAKSDNISFHEVAEKNVDMGVPEELVHELKKLRATLETRATTPREIIAANIIKAAEEAAVAKDKGMIKDILAKTGKWTADVAKEIGTSLVTKLIESSIGLG